MVRWNRGLYQRKAKRRTVLKKEFAEDIKKLNSEQLAKRYVEKYYKFATEFSKLPKAKRCVNKLKSTEDAHKLEQDQCKFAVTKCLMRYGAPKRLNKVRNHKKTVQLVLKEIEPEDSAAQILEDMQGQLDVSNRKVNSLGAMGTIMRVLNVIVSSVNKTHVTESILADELTRSRIRDTWRAFGNYEWYVSQSQAVDNAMEEYNAVTEQVEAAHRRPG